MQYDLEDGSFVLREKHNDWRIYGMLRKTRVPYTEKLDGLFHPLSLADNRAHELTREKARNWDRAQHQQ